MNYTIGIDLGGTNIKAGALDGSGARLLQTSIETQAERGYPHVFERLVELIKNVRSQLPAGAAGQALVGIGVPGPMSHAEGLIHSAPNMPGWENIPLKQRLQDATGLPVNVENDANSAAFGEFAAGAGRGTREMALLTLGTGIGGGLVSAGRLQRGFFDNAGEIGHMLVELNGRACPCGQRGCLERYCSATAIANDYAVASRAGRQGSNSERDPAERGAEPASVTNAAGDVSAADVSHRAAAGDAIAQKIWDEACRYLALACVNLQHLVNPELIVFSGGLTGAGSQLLELVQRHFEQLTWRAAEDFPRIRLAALGGDAGWIGAAALARAELA